MGSSSEAGRVWAGSWFKRRAGLWLESTKEFRKRGQIPAWKKCTLLSCASGPRVVGFGGRKKEWKFV